MEENKSQNLISEEAILGKIFVFRGKKVMLDKDLAKLYEVTLNYETHCHCEEERSDDEAIPRLLQQTRDCFVASLLAMTGVFGVS